MEVINSNSILIYICRATEVFTFLYCIFFLEYLLKLIYEQVNYTSFVYV
nr:MAG TPA: hypothetical protein [Caudoviricetes sp.]